VNAAYIGIFSAGQHGVLPHTVVCRGARQTTRRFPRRFADDFAASGTDTADLAGFAARWRERVAGVA